MRRIRRNAVLAACAAVLSALPPACDFTLSQERPGYDDLDEAERAAVDRIFGRVVAFDSALRVNSVTGIGREYTLGPPAEDHSRIDVSFHDLWIATNLGDDVIHLSVWENLTSAQRSAWASWFGETVEAAKPRYETFFHDYVAVHLAAIQAVFRIQTVEYVYTRRTLFNLERDGQRLAVPYLRAYDPALLSWAHAACAVILARFADDWGSHYDKDYYIANLRSLTDPVMPTGWIYFLCRHMADAEVRGVEDVGRPYTFAEELSVIPRD